jgi:hypothetical protein
MGGMNGMSGGMGGGFGGGMGGFGGGMNRGGMGMGMSGMGGMGGQQQQGAGLKIQWVSNAALNAVASESTPGPNGPQNAFKIYAKDMIIVLVITPIFLVLAVTGALTNLGFVLGDALVDFIAGFGNLA